MFHNDNFVITGNARVLWDGITRPEALDGGGQKHSLKVAMIASAPECGELQVILDRELNNGEFRGTLPAGALPGIGETRPGEFGDMLPGHKVFNTVTYNGVPDVFDINGQKLDAMQYSSMLYPGATVQLIVSARTYNNKSKGLGFWLNGIKIIDATTPKLPVGGGGVDAAAAFGAAAGNTSQTAQPPAAQQTAAAAQSATDSMPAPDASAAVPGPGPDMVMINGQQYDVAALKASGKWTDTQIDALR